MDDPVIATIEEPVEVERLWLEQRQRAADILAEQKTHLEEIDLRLAAQVEMISAQLSAGANDFSQEHQAEVQRVRAELDERQLKLEQDQEKSALELQQWSDQLRQKQQELERRADELEAESRKITERERALETARHEYDTDVEQLARRTASFEEQQQRLSSELESVEARREAAKQEQQQAATEHSEQRQKQIEEVERRRAELESVQSSWQQEADRKNEVVRRDMAAEQAEIENQRAECEQERRQLASERAEMEQARLQLDNARSEVDRRAEALTNAQHGDAATDQELAQLREQCKRLADEAAVRDTAAQEHAAHKTAHAAQLEQSRREIEHLQAELHAATELAHGVEQDLIAQRTAYDSLAQQLTAQGESQATQAQLDSLACERDELAARLEQAQAELAAAADADQGRADLAEQLDLANQEATAAAERIRELEDRLAAADAQAGCAASEAAADDQQSQDLQRRFELAVEDVRSLKRRNAELEDQLSGLQAGRGESGAAPLSNDWESLKKRMMAELEADTSSAPERKAERASIESTIRITDNVVVEKDREIEELKQLLSEQSDNLGSMAVGAAAVEGIFDQDELIRQERERLQQAQVEWRDKLRQAEIDVSLERARIARERVELEEKLRVLEAERSQEQAAGAGHGNAKGSKPARGRWLERLGLKDAEKS